MPNEISSTFKIKTIFTGGDKTFRPPYTFRFVMRAVTRIFYNYLCHPQRNSNTVFCTSEMGIDISIDRIHSIRH
ncbi:Hypothetical predicted protein [Octopus vulgaris]|uniref:Uncharacterized protein n=1 Tax=Octopus vulgaris TaxID=6645 RepID=A0AA36F0Q4_OCTVU|nr:Hypothetical predicted protein [Octopus vulgaris]